MLVFSSLIIISNWECFICRISSSPFTNDVSSNKEELVSSTNCSLSFNKEFSELICRLVFAMRNFASAVRCVWIPIR